MKKIVVDVTSFDLSAEVVQQESVEVCFPGRLTLEDQNGYRIILSFHEVIG